MQLEIIIWDIDPLRISQIDQNLHMAMQELGIKGIVTCNSEPPSIVRAGLLDRVPVLEAADKYWSNIPGEVISLAACITLLKTITQLK